MSVASSKQKLVVVRVTGLPHDLSKQTAKQELLSLIEAHLEDQEKHDLKWTVQITASCYEDLGHVALVDFENGLPLFLSNLQSNPLGEWQIEMGDSDLTFDRHFFGFTQLYSLQEGSPVNAE